MRISLSSLFVLIFGSFLFVCNAMGELCDLKILSPHYRAMESYLERVLQKEMGGGFHLEALKAQAVAARTVTLIMLKRGKADPEADDYGLASQQASVSRQTPISPAVAQAVKETAGQVLINDHVNSCLQYPFYHSHCGNHLLEPDEVWEKSGIYGLINPAICAQHASPAGKPVAMAWQYKIKKASLVSQMTNYHFPANLRTHFRLEKMKAYFKPQGDQSHSQSGYRIERFEFFATDKRSGKNQILSLAPNVFRSLMPKESPNLFKSTLIEGVNLTHSDGNTLNGFTKERPGEFFEVDLINLPAEAMIHFSGRGFGHGAGLCQYGANGSAMVEGLLYHDILYRYFPNLTLAGVVNY